MENKRKKASNLAKIMTASIVAALGGTLLFLDAPKALINIDHENTLQAINYGTKSIVDAISFIGSLYYIKRV